MSDKPHIGLCADDGCKPLAHNGVIVGNEDAHRTCLVSTFHVFPCVSGLPALVVCDADPRAVSGRRCDAELGAYVLAPLLHVPQAHPAARGGSLAYRVKAVAVVQYLHRDRLTFHRQVDGHVSCVRVLQRVVQRLLRDLVEAPLRPQRQIDLAVRQETSFDVGTSFDGCQPVVEGADKALFLEGGRVQIVDEETNLANGLASGVTDTLKRMVCRLDVSSGPAAVTPLPSG